MSNFREHPLKMDNFGEKLKSLETRTDEELVTALYSISRKRMDKIYAIINERKAEQQKKNAESKKQAILQQKERSTLFWKIVHLHHISDVQRKKLYPEMKKAPIPELKEIRKLLVEDINSEQPKVFKHQPLGWYNADRRRLLSELNAIIGDHKKEVEESPQKSLRKIAGIFRRG